MNTFKKITLIIHLIKNTPKNLLIIFFNIISSFLTLLGIPMLLPAIDILSNGETDKHSAHYKLIYSLFEKIGVEVNFYSIVILALAFIFSSHIIILFIELFSRRIQIKIINNYMIELIESYNNSNWLWMTGDQSGRFHSAVSRETHSASEAHLDSLRLISSSFQLFTYLIIAFLISYKFTIWAFIFFIIMSIPTIYYSNKLNFISNRNNKGQILLSSYISNLTHNKKFFKASKNYKTFIKLITDQVKKINKMSWKLAIYDGGLRTFTVLCGMLFIISIFLFHTKLSLNVPELLLLIIVFTRVVPQFNLLSNNFSRVFERIPIYLSVRERIDNLNLNKEIDGEKKFISFSEVNFENVSFSYLKDVSIIKNINLKISPKKTLAIIGSSGSGKSTLLDLFLGLLKPKLGKISYGNIDNKNLNYKSLREKVAYVSQETTLLDGSLKYNLTIANPEAEISKIQKVCETTMLTDVIKTLPNGLDTQIGENGVKLSGGQRQRVAIARALINEPEFLILDEATSQLDLETEKYIRETIKKLSSNLTIIIVAHRLSTVKNADNIYVLEKGEIIEQGTYNDLIKKKGRLFELDHINEN